MIYIYSNRSSGLIKIYVKKMAKKSQEQTIMDFEKKHGKRYDYSLVQYENAVTKVNIICKIHGLFSITPNSHKNGSGCSKCGRLVVDVSRKSTNYM